MTLLLLGDINLNPGPVTRHQLKDPKFFEAFNTLSDNTSSVTFFHKTAKTKEKKTDLHNFFKVSILTK